MFNKITLIGYVGKDGYDLRYSPAGKPVANFKLGVKRNFKNQEGNYEWDNFNIVHWGQGAEWNADKVDTKSLVLVDGRLQVRTYDGQDGQKRWITEVIADTVRCLSPKDNDNHGFGGSELDFDPDDIPL